MFYIVNIKIYHYENLPEEARKIQDNILSEKYGVIWKYMDDKQKALFEKTKAREKIVIDSVFKLNESVFNEWPENYQDLYGSIDDDSFFVNQK